MSARLIYVIGPSGAGKDSVLQALREIWQELPPAYWTRRTITRPVQPEGEAHENVTPPEFERLCSEGAFAMAWRANELSYGVRTEELIALSQGYCVFVNGSRAYLPQIMARWPSCTVVQISASPDVLLQRLNRRNRESTQAISQRMARTVEVELPQSAISIVNDGSLQEAAQSLLTRLQIQLRNAPACLP
jgi:ribose 1,5-bisphosphokinase